VHLNSLLLFRRYALCHFTDRVRVLEIGPDDEPSTYRREVTGPVDWTTADLATEAGTTGERRWGGGQVSLAMPSEYEIPAEQGQFDVVLSAQVIEHVRRPWLWMPELARVCAPGGLVITVNPVSWPYHEAPVDCWRIYPEGMTALCVDAGLTLELCRTDCLERKPRNWYPGASSDHDSRQLRRWLNRGKATLGWPLPVAFDTITVARKPFSRTA
jgi:SAM-dependent methyltransferase